MFSAPKKKGGGAVIVAVLLLLAFLFGKKDTVPPGPKPILAAIGEPDITPAGTINQGETKIITWLCQNTGDGEGIAALRIDEVSPVAATGLFLGVNVVVSPGQTINILISATFNFIPGDYTMKVVMLDSTGVALPTIAARNFPLTIAQLTPKAILTAGTLVIT